MREFTLPVYSQLRHILSIKLDFLPIPLHSALFRLFVMKFRAHIFYISDPLWYTHNYFLRIMLSKIIFFGTPPPLKYFLRIIFLKCVESSPNLDLISKFLADHTKNSKIIRLNSFLWDDAAHVL